jgi:hypothetical protein
MTNYSSANLVSLVACISPVVQVVFWFSFPSVNAMAGGSPYENIDIIMNSLSLPILIAGTLLFRFNEKETKAPETDIELCPNPCGCPNPVDPLVAKLLSE